MGLSCMIYYHVKYGDFMHNCILRASGYSFFNKYGREHYEAKMIIMFIIMLQWSLFPLGV